MSTTNHSPPKSKDKANVFTILYFAAAADYTSVPSETLPAPLPLSKLYSMLEGKYPGITEKVLRGCAVSLNLEYVDVDVGLDGQRSEGGGKEDGKGEDVVIKAGDEVGIVPPVSGG